MKFIASVGAALTLAAAVVAVTSPAFSQIAPRGIVAPQPIGPVVTAPNAEIALPPIAAAPAEEPPRLTVTWENGLPSFGGVVESLNEKYTLFLPDGRAVRPSATPNLEKQGKQGNAPRREEESDEEPDETP